MKCNKFYSPLELKEKKNHPYCSCGGLIKPDVVLYEEQLDGNIIDESLNKIVNAKVLIVAGTSLTVQPAASFVKYFRGSYLIVINKETTNLDKFATIVFHENVGEILEEAVKNL